MVRRKAIKQSNHRTETRINHIKYWGSVRLGDVTPNLWPELSHVLASYSLPTQKFTFGTLRINEISPPLAARPMPKHFALSAAAAATSSHAVDTTMGRRMRPGSVLRIRSATIQFVAETIRISLTFGAEQFIGKLCWRASAQMKCICDCAEDREMDLGRDLLEC